MNKKEIKTVVIPAAGYGSRLFPASMTLSKILFPIGNKTILSFILEECMFAGIKNLIFIISPEQLDIVKYLTIDNLNTLLKKFPKSNELNLHKSYLESFDSIKFVIQSKARGLGDAILQAQKSLEYDEDFAVILGDNPIITENTLGISELLKVYYNNPKNNVLGLVKVKDEDVSKYGIASIDEDRNNLVTGVIEKPKNIPCSNNAIMGRYIFKYNIFDYLKANKKITPSSRELDLSGALNDTLNDSRNISGCLIQAEVEDTGNVDGYLLAIKKYDEQRIK